MHWTEEPERVKGLTLAQSKQVMAMDTPSSPLLPPVTATVVVTLLLGVLGCIPAMVHSDRARALGESGSKYWIAFAAVLVLNTLALLVILL